MGIKLLISFQIQRSIMNHYLDALSEVPSEDLSEMKSTKQCVGHFLYLRPRVTKSSMHKFIQNLFVKVQIARMN